MSFLGVLVGTVGAICTGVTTFISGCAAALKTLVSPTLDLLIRVGKVVIEGVCKIVGEIAKTLGIVKPDTEPEELGARAKQNPDIRPEDFPSTQDYIAALEEAPFDKEKFDKLSPVEKGYAAIVGASIEAKGISERVRMNIPLDFYAAAVKGQMTAKESISLLESLKKNKIDDASLFTAYSEGRLTQEEEMRIKPALDLYDANNDRNMSEIQRNILTYKEKTE